MKSIALLLFLVPASCIAQAQATSSLSGKWKLHTSMIQESDSICTLTLNETELSGTCDGDNGQVKISGKVDGKKVSWSYKTEYGGNELTVSYAGNLESDTKMSGSSGVAEMGLVGEFTAMKDDQPPTK